MDFHHVSIMLKECLEGLNIKEDGIYVDGTMGGAGHTKAIGKCLGEKGKIIGFDQDIDAINTGKKRLEEFGDKAILIHSNFCNIKEELHNVGIEKIDGLLLDLGVSSYQLDNGERGFSYMQDAPLDMRMDRRQNVSAYEVVNNYDKKELEDILYSYGEEKWSKRIVEFIDNARKEKPIETTFELIDIIKAAIPKKARDENQHPAKRTFQAIRIEVNAELDVIGKTIKDAVEIMNPGGRIAIITFHSLEDRIVKKVFKELENSCVCPPEFPVCICDKEAQLKVITRKPIIPSDEEIELNPRSRSSKLRVAEKL